MRYHFSVFFYLIAGLFVVGAFCTYKPQNVSSDYIFSENKASNSLQLKEYSYSNHSNPFGWCGENFVWYLRFLWGSSCYFIFVLLPYSFLTQKRRKKLSGFILYWISSLLLWGCLAALLSLTGLSLSSMWMRGGQVGTLLAMKFMPLFNQFGSFVFFFIATILLASIFFKIDFVRILVFCISRLALFICRCGWKVCSKVKGGQISLLSSSMNQKKEKEILEIDMPLPSLDQSRDDARELTSINEPVKEQEVSIIEYKKKMNKQGKRNYLEGLPSIELLDRIETPRKDKQTIERELKEKSRSLIKTLKEFKMGAQVVKITQGPSVSVFEIKLDPGLKVSRIVSLSDELSLSVKAKSLRVLGAIPGKSSIGIEVSNDHPETVSLRQLLEDEIFQEEKSPLTIALGQDITAKLILSRLDKMPHLLIAGSTGSGKSVCMNALIMSVLFKASPDQVRFIMVDPKMVELSFYEDIPHLITPVVVNPEKASDALKWAVIEMERRYRIFSEIGVRNIEGYQKRCEVVKGAKEELENMPYIMVIVDELADLMMTCSKDVETSIARLAQKSRAVGIHMVLATQRPTVNVITGLIKANLPCRIAFRVSSAIDSRTILDSKGAERLIGRGDMLFIPPGASDAKRVQGAFVSDDEIKRVVNYIKEQYQGYEVDSKDIFSQVEEESVVSDSTESDDPMYEKAKEVILTHRKASGSFLQRKLGVGYNRGARLIEELERNGIVSQADTNGRRDILV